MSHQYLTEDLVKYILNLQYNKNLYFSEDRYVLQDKTTFTLSYIKYILNSYNWNWDEISYDIFNRLLIKSLTAIYIRIDYDILLQENDKNSFYIYKGHSGHLVTDPHLIASHFKVINPISLSAIKNFCVDETNKQNVEFPNSAHLIVKKILSTNISIIY